MQPFPSKAKTLWRLALACCAATLGAGFCASGAQAQGYTAIGDSLTYGVNANPGNPPTGSPHPNGFAPTFNARRVARGGNPTFHNRGISGATSQDVIDTQLTPAVNDAPDLVTLTVGTNDIRQAIQSPTPPTPQAFGTAFGTRLNTLFATLRNGTTQATRPIFATNVPPLQQLPAFASLDSQTKAAIAAYVQAANSAFTQVAPNYGVTIVDLFSDPNSVNPANISSPPEEGGDGVHPNATGHALLARKFFAAAGLQETGSLTVTRGDDVTDAFDDQTTLREAIAFANGNGNPTETDTITFADNVRGTINLSTIDDTSNGNSAFRLAQNVSIQGPGNDALTVRRDTGGTYRLFLVNSGVTASISGLTLANGNLAGNGGAIYSNGALTLTSSTLSGNTAGNYGGAILNSGTLTLTSSTLFGNSAYAAGGIANVGTAMVTSSTLSGNTAGNYGGAILNSGTLTLTSSTLFGNSATGTANFSGGGALDAVGNSSHVTISSCTITGNTAPNVAGGTLSGLWLENGTLTLSNNIVAGNGPQDIQQDAGTFTSNGYNLIGNPGNATGFISSDKVGTAASPLDAGFDPAGLKNNGGPTQTVALAAGSPAIDSGSTTLTTDQRGVARDASPDRGAFEYVNSAPVLSNIESGTLAYTEDDAPTQISNTLAVSDDGPTLSGATVSITSGFAPSEDELLFTEQNGISGSYDPTTGVLTLSGGASLANYQAALRSVKYNNSNNASPSSSNRIVSFQVNDGAFTNNLSNTLTRTISITQSNDAPMNSVPGAQSTDEDTALVFDDPTTWSSNGISVDDADGDTLTLTLSVEHGTLTLSQTSGLTFVTGDGTADATLKFSGSIADLNGALANLSYTPALNFNGDDTLTLSSDDGTAPAVTSTVAITVNAVNDAPVVESVSIAPHSPSTTSVLTANVSASDVEGDAFALSYQWQRNGNDIAGATGPTLDLSKQSNIVAGDVITVIVTATETATTDKLASQPKSDSVTIDNQSPSVVAITPQNVTDNVGAQQTFTLSVSDPNGAGDIREMWLLVNTQLDWSGGATLVYFPQTGQLYLRRGDSFGTPIKIGQAAGASDVLDNGALRIVGSQVQLVANADGNTLTLSVPATVRDGLVGNNTLFGRVQDFADQVDPASPAGDFGFVPFGSYTVKPQFASDSNTVPTLSALSPKSAYTIIPTTGAKLQTFVFYAKDENGIGDLDSLWFSAGKVHDGPNNATFIFLPRTRRLYLRSDDGSSFIGGGQIGTQGTIENSQVKVELSKVQYLIYADGKMVGLRLPLQPKAGLLGQNKIWLRVQDNEGATSAGGDDLGFVQSGTWNVTQQSGGAVAGVPSAPGS